MSNWAPIIAAVISLIGSAVLALMSWTLRTEITMLRTEIKFELAKAENNFFQRVNGSYVRKELHAGLVERMEKVENKIDEFE